jgi:hypothetical protein
VTHYFLDSSALVKRYISEGGTRWVRIITAQRAGNVILIAQVTPVEVVSALSRREREGYLSPSNAHAARVLLDRHTDHLYESIGLSAKIAAGAKYLLEKGSLRAYDAIQLASALESNDQLVAAGLPPLVFVSADKRLLEVATAQGLATDNPTDHP